MENAQIIRNAIYLSDDAKTVQKSNVHVHWSKTTSTWKIQDKLKEILSLLSWCLHQTRRIKWLNLKNNTKKVAYDVKNDKRYLNKVLEEELDQSENVVKSLLKIQTLFMKCYEGSKKANKVANQTLKEVREAIGLIILTD